MSASEEGELLAPDSEVISSLSSSTAVVVVLKVGARDGVRVVVDTVEDEVLYEPDGLCPFRESGPSSCESNTLRQTGIREGG